MNLKVTNLIAIQFGMFVGIMAWLAYSRLPSAEPRLAEPRIAAAAETQGSALSAGANVAAVVQPKDPRPEPANYNAEREEAQPVKEKRPDWETVYYQSISPQRYAQGAVQTTYTAAQSPSHTETIREPAVVSPDYAPTQPIIVYEQPAPVIVYAEPIQPVVFSNSRHHANRRRPIRRACPPQTNPRLSSNLLSSGPSGNVLSRANAVGPACQPVQAFRPQGIVRQGPRNR